METDSTIPLPDLAQPPVFWTTQQLAVLGSLLIEAARHTKHERYQTFASGLASLLEDHLQP